MPKPIQMLSTSDSELKSKIGLSSKKVEYLKDLSAKVVDGKLNLDLLSTMSDEEVINQ
jgi:DNA-3-methyladenine glycosylase II